MTDKKLKHLSRSELLEMLLEQSKEVERLKSELDIAEKALSNRKIMIDNAGSIADAALRMSEIFKNAQDAADIYLDNIRSIERETKRKAEEIINDAYKRNMLND